MIKHFRLRRGGIFFLALLVLALEGCGRRGPLEPPPGAPAAQATAQPPESNYPGQANNPPLPGQTPVTGSNANPPSKGPSFFMDPLVK